MGPRVELKQEPVSPLIVIKNPWVILLTSGLLFDITTALHLVLYRHLAANVATAVYVFRVGEYAEDTKTATVRQSRSLSMLSNPASQQTRKWFREYNSWIFFYIFMY